MFQTGPIAAHSSKFWTVFRNRSDSARTRTEAALFYVIERVVLLLVVKMFSSLIRAYVTRASDTRISETRASKTRTRNRKTLASVTDLIWTGLKVDGFIVHMGRR